MSLKVVKKSQALTIRKMGKMAQILKIGVI